MIYHPGRLCFCGCGKPAEYRSKYATKECAYRVGHTNRQAKIFVGCIEPGCTNSRHGTTQYCLEHCRHTAHRTKEQEARWDAVEKAKLRGVHMRPSGALIYYPECSQPDRMSKTMAEKCIKMGDFRPGDVIMMDGKRIEITARMRADERARQEKMML